MATGAPKKTRKRKIPPMDFSDCIESTPEDTLKFILGLEIPDWKLIGSRIGDYEGTSVTHFFLEYCGDAAFCEECGCKKTLYDYKERCWRHANLDKAVCYIHAKIPRFKCINCGKIAQIDVPWADPNVTYSKRFMEVAIEHLAHMSIAATSRLMICSWSVLDDIVGRIVKDHLDEMDLSGVRRIRIDETSAKKRHRYITVITDADTGDIIFITKGKDSKTVAEFADWLISHKGKPENIILMASDFGESFILGAKEHLPNALNAYDPFHLIQLGNQKLDKDRSVNQVNGHRLKSIRYALLKNKANLTEEEERIVTDISLDNGIIGLSYQMNMSLRQTLEIDDAELARMYLEMWVDWVDKEGSANFRALSKTVRKHMEGIILALETGMNNGYQEGLNGRIQFSKRVANGYRKESRLARIVFFRDSIRGLTS